MGTPLKHILEVFKRFKKQCYSNVTPGRRKQSSCSFTDEPVTAHSHLQHMSDDLPLLSPIFPFRLVAQGALSFISTGPEPKMNFQPSRRVGSGLHLRVITYSYAVCVYVCVFFFSSNNFVSNYIRTPFTISGKSRLSADRLRYI